jgi:hypothetical protein
MSSRLATSVKGGRSGPTNRNSSWQICSQNPILSRKILVAERQLPIDLPVTNANSCAQMEPIAQETVHDTQALN